MPPRKCMSCKWGKLFSLPANYHCVHPSISKGVQLCKYCHQLLEDYYEKKPDTYTIVRFDNLDT